MTNKGIVRIVCGSCLVLALLAPILAQVVSRVEIGKTSSKKFVFDHSGQDLQGQSITADAVEFIFRKDDPLIPPVTILISELIKTGSNSFKVTTVLDVVPDGEYQATVRIRAIGGNWSEESSILDVKISSKKPQAPESFGVSG